MSKRKARPRLADWHLWTEVKRTVSPLRAEPPSFDELAEATLPIPVANPPPVFDKGAKWAGPTLPPYVPPISGRRPTEPGQVIEPRLKRRLVRGQIELDGTIDLHGMRQVEAHEALQRFILAGVAVGDRTVLVITGKGLPKGRTSTDEARLAEPGVLRKMLPRWLADPALAPLIAGWDAAAQGHGGQGAFYVRLRRGVK